MGIIRICFLTMAGALLAQTTAAAPAVFDFENGSLDGFGLSRLTGPYSGQASSEEAHWGQRSARFELRRGDFTHNGFRAEVKDLFNAGTDSSVTYAFSTYFPPDFSMPPGGRCIFAQWHDQDMDVRPVTDIHSPPLAVSYSDTLKVKLCQADAAERCVKSTLFESPNFALGRWHDFVFQIHWSTSANGSVTAWMDGARIISFNGPIGYPIPGHRGENVGPYFKLGLYCDFNPSQPLIVYHDDYVREPSGAASRGGLAREARAPSAAQER